MIVPLQGIYAEVNTQQYFNRTQASNPTTQGANIQGKLGPGRVGLPLPIQETNKSFFGFPIFAGIPHLIDFENSSVGTPVFNQFKGITFIRGDNSTHPITITQSTLPTVSPNHILEGKVRDLNLRFDIPQYRVSLSTGLSNDIKPLGNNYGVLLRGWTSIPHAAGSKLIAQNITACLGKGPTPINTPLQVTDL